MSQIEQVIRNIKGNPLGEAFLMSALESYSRQVLADDSDWGHSLINKQAWQSLALKSLTMLGCNEVEKVGVEGRE